MKFHGVESGNLHSLRNWRHKSERAMMSDRVKYLPGANRTWPKYPTEH